MKIPGTLLFLLLAVFTGLFAACEGDAPHMPEISDVASLPDGTLWIATNDGRLIRFAADGAKRDQAVKHTVRSLFFLNNELGWQITGEGDVLMTRDGGKEWISLSKLNGIPLYGRDHLRFIDERNGWFSGDHGFWSTGDGGASWIYRPWKETRDAPDLFPVNFTDVWAWSRDGNILISTDGGSSWSGNSKWPSRSFQALSKKTAFAGLFEGGLLLTTDAGANWKQILLKDLTSGYMVDSIRFANEEAGWVICVEIDRKSREARRDAVMLATRDAGKNWERLAAPDEGGELYLANGKPAWIVSDRDIYRFANEGETWEKIPNLKEQ